ncbi:MAG: phosphoglucosamine mutase [Alphaproteobacteria bacterium]|nr:phosphoglucosamine mutase [Alphaproteobacteria bacterium]
MKNLFGTDGIRGIANEYPVNIDICIKLANAIYLEFLKDNPSAIVLIGKDTRLSGDMLEHAISAAFCSLGVSVKLLGVIPTPCVSILVKEWKADLGLMISASHNPYYDNGIKLFDHEGMKLNDQRESKLEDLIFNFEQSEKIPSKKIGKVFDCSQEAKVSYIQNVENSFAFNINLSKSKKIVIDSANGALSNIASVVFEHFGFNVISLSEAPTGININDGCGVMHPDHLQNAVTKFKADFGIAFDGDGDRVLICDENGQLLNGDELLAILSLLDNHSEIVATIMSNFGFEKYLNSRNIKLIRTNVGDRYISEYMKNHEAEIGGETSGHIVIKSHAPTGDGLFSGLSVVLFALEHNLKFSQLHLFKPYPTVNVNVRIKNKSVIHSSLVSETIQNCEKDLNGEGRLIVRPSGTEPLIRISAEGEEKSTLEKIVNEIKKSIENADK